MSREIGSRAVRGEAENRRSVESEQDKLYVGPVPKTTDKLFKNCEDYWFVVRLREISEPAR
jgi:hypothetical protein